MENVLVFQAIIDLKGETSSSNGFYLLGNHRDTNLWIQDDKGPSINDVTQIFGVFAPLPLFVTHSHNLSVICHALGNPPPL